MSDEWFDLFKKHYEKYDTNDKNIVRKYFHSLRVADLSSNIAKDLMLNDEEVSVAKLIGLLHDYARFKQWTDYKTYNDIKSLDHGDLAVAMLFDNGEIKDYLVDTKYYQIIYDAIKYHNKFSIGTNVNELFCNIVRDADKLDIFYLNGNKDVLDESDELISEKIENEFYQNHLISYSDVKNSNEKILLTLARIFDINFKYSYKYIYENNLLWKMYDNINNKDLFKKYFDYADKYVKERID